MRYRLLGSSGLRVSEFALGTMTFGEPRSWGIDERTARLILDKFAEAGGTFLDTANIYSDGEAERILGEFLRPDRDRFVTCALVEKGGSGWGGCRWVMLEWAYGDGGSSRVGRPVER